MLPKKRGRPKSDKTLQAEEIDELFSNAPSHLKAHAEELKKQEEFIKFIQNSLKELHADFSPTIPHSVIEDFASIYDESMHGFEREILDSFYKSNKTLAEGQKVGGNVIATRANKRAQIIWEKNSDLARRIMSKNLTVNGASKIIFDNWDIRGDTDTKPSIRTIRSWYQRS